VQTLVPTQHGPPQSEQGDASYSIAGGTTRSEKPQHDDSNDNKTNAKLHHIPGFSKSAVVGAHTSVSASSSTQPAASKHGRTFSGGSGTNTKSESIRENETQNETAAESSLPFLKGKGALTH